MISIPRIRIKRVLALGIPLIISLILVASFVILPAQAADKSSNPYVVRTFVDEEGREIDEVIFPGRPPEIKAPVAAVPEPNPAMGINTLSNVPAFDWCYGCSATSAAMMCGYYDNVGYGNMYAGPTNGGVCPMDNSGWGQTWWPSGWYSECPLSATHQGYDGLVIYGHVDDYWIDYGNPGPDPFIGSWSEHTQGDCTADYMGTNQSNLGNTDGSTTFWWYTDGDPLYDYTGCEPGGYRDGCHGMWLFAESRGYTVNSNFSQMIKGQGSDPNKGFTFADFCSEIDAGRPVIIQVEGHSMLGYGYNTAGNIVYIHDTWDHLDHQMTWGGTYGTSPPLQQLAVTVMQLESVAPVELEFGDAPDPTYPSLLASDGARHNPTATEILGLASSPDSKDFELDAKVADLDLFDDGLLTTTITAGNPAQTVQFEVTNFIATDNLIVNILIDLNGDGDWKDIVGAQSEHVVQNQVISLPGPAENTFVSAPFSTVGATLGPTWLRITLTRHDILNPPWDGTMAGHAPMTPFECGETEDWEITIEEAVTSYNITVVEGWNLISLPLIPDSTNITDIISADNLGSGNMDNVELVYYFDTASEIWLWWNGSPASSLTTMEDGLGYWMLMNGADTLTVHGIQVGEPPPEYGVIVGWNMIGFTSVVAMAPEVYLASVAGDYTLLYGWNAVGETWLWWNGSPASILTTMEPGDGYWILMDNPGTITPP